MGSEQMPDTEDKKRLTGSVTVEAALVFPIFFFACLALCYLFVFMKTEYFMQREIFDVARDLSGYGAVIEPVVKIRDKFTSEAESSIYGDAGKKQKADIVQALTSLLPSGGNGISLKNLLTNTVDSLIFENILENRIPDEVASCIADGLDCSGSILYDIDKCVQIKCSYSFKLPFGLFSDLRIPVEHTIRFRYFTGTEVKSLLEEVKDEGDGEEGTEDEEEEQVLITDTGKCYHYSYSCPALNVKPSCVRFSDVGGKRNANGGKYYPCEYCVKGKTELSECYITPEGDRYHSDKKCQGLKRTISKVPISEVGKRRECKRCRDSKGTLE